MTSNSLINSQRIIYQCNFNDGCNGLFSYSTNDLEAGLFQYIDGISTDLGYDITDFTSISIYFKAIFIYDYLIQIFFIIKVQ
jgi:hypothetical protein